MKHIRILTVAVLTSLFTLTSCESFFDVDFQDQANIEGIFKESRTTKQYLRQIYSYVPMDEETVGSNGWVVPRSDEAQFSYYQWVYYINYKTGNYSSATTDFNYWNTFYIAINQCTTFMKYVHLDEKEGNERVVPYMMAEARFLRAYYYFCLFRQYGPVFLWYNELPDPDNVDGATIDRHTVEENVKWIVDELDLAAEDLPLRVGEIESEEAWMGRVTKGAALALKSRVLLYAASPLYNGTNLYRGQMQNMRGDYLFPQEPDQDKWQAAADAAWDVIDLSMYQLYETTGSDSFSKAAASYQGVMLEPWNSETIWGWWWRTSSAYTYMGTIGASIDCALPPQFGFYEAHGGVAPSLKLVDSYPMMESGRYPVTGYQGQNDMSRPVIDPLSGYKADGFTENYTQPLLGTWAGTIKAHNSCIGRDPRFYASVVPNGFWWPHQNINKRFTCYNSQEATSRWSADANCIRVGYAWKRLYKANTNISTDTETKAIKAVYPAFRLAEIYLNYAEACNEKPDRNETDALEYLNKVRRRSGLNDIQIAYPEIAGDKELLRWCIQKERMVEFGMEAMRHYDACRWMIAKSEYPGANWTLNVSAPTYEASYNRVSTDFIGAPSIFRDKDYLFPIGARQLAEMTNMTQNYGH